ncbi:MAG TPA: pectinesterase family protein, partial [Candidatus Dojkabacteria bacterium]|nr:pectinesterase family protein [Candidatus Dojkabacteria bacterium]
MKKKFSRVIAHHLPQCLLLFSILTSNVLFPATVIAQEIENTNNVTQEETVPIDTSEDILEEGISTSIYEEEEVVEPLFVFENGIYTVNTVVEGEEYVYPDNNDVRVKFTEVTQEGNLVIKRVELTEEQKELLNTKDNYGWDITSSMSNGTFKYNLTLPNTQGNKDIEVKYTEDGNEYESIDNSNIEIKSNVVTIEGLEHFTTFIVVNPLPINVNNGGSCTVASINGVCYNTIQGAINAARSNGETEQDVINIRNGTYKECLSISGKNIQLLGESKAGVIIDNTSCSSYGIDVYNANQIIFENMTVN